MIICKGTLKKREALVSVAVDENGHIKFSPNGEYHFIVDTGFAGDIAVPHSMLPKLKIKFLGYDKFVLATQKSIHLPVFEGWILIGRENVQVEMIPGDELIGVKLLERICSKLIFDFKNATVKLTI